MAELEAWMLVNVIQNRPVATLAILAMQLVLVLYVAVRGIVWEQYVVCGMAIALCMYVLVESLS